MAKLPTSNCRAFTLATIILLFLLAACARDGRPTPQRLVDGTRSGATLTITATATATITPSSTPSPTSTNTPTPTPTPTATAPSALISGDLRASVLRAPEPQPGAVCGIVDVFDFPVDPPDALAVDRGGTDYNRYRERYNGFHAGEDWGGPNGRRLGSPVYSIGHGRVIYAHPYGWGVDQGTVIIRHVLDDGSQILSFYGHLDPPSVNLRYGECVARGDKIGEIGDPRGRPHLHFEIRNHMPAEPGPGYWSVDPTLAGWFPPSLTIWTSRIESSPGFLWSRPPAADDVFADIEASALLPNDVLVLLADGRLQGIGGGDGATRWIQPDPPTPTPEPDATLDPTRVAREVEAAAPVSAALDEEAPVLYAVDRRGRLQAYSTTDEAPAFEPLWQVELEISGPPALYPLPHGGVVTLGRGEMVALDVDGRQQWRQPLEQAPDDVVRTGDHLFLIEGGREPTLWSLTITRPTPLPGLPTGTPVAGAGSDLWLYSRDALYRLDPTMQKAELVMRLPTAFYGIAIHGNGDALALPDGGLLVAHQDLDDSRLLRFDGSGQLLWERSYRVVGDGGAQLTLLDGRVYLILIEEGATMTVTLLSVEMETGNLLRLFVGGTREGVPQDTWLFAGPAGTLFLNIGGGHLVALDPQQAVEALAPAP